MFVGYGVGVKCVLRKGEKRVVVGFGWGIGEVMGEWERKGFDYGGDNEDYGEKLSVFSGKGGYW